MPRAEQDLRGSVPERDNLGPSTVNETKHTQLARSIRTCDPYLVGISPHGNTKRPRQAEICKLEVVAFVDQQVLGLEIAMKDSVRMAIKETGTELMSEFLTTRGEHQSVASFR